MRHFLVSLGPCAREEIQRHIEVKLSRHEAPHLHTKAIREKRSCHPFHTIIKIIGVGNTFTILFAD